MERKEVRPFFNSGLGRLFQTKWEAMAGGWGNTIARSFIPSDLHNMLLE
jgi:hypothetical protein